MKAWLSWATNPAALLRGGGWPAAIATVLTLLAASGALWLAFDRTALEDKRRTLAAHRLSLMQSSANATSAEISTALAASLPPDNLRQVRTAALLALTKEYGLTWPRTEFRYHADRELGVAQVRVAMQLGGRYSVVRDFVGEALRRDPALALDGLQLRRDTNGLLKAELAWVLHMQVAH